MSTLKQKWTGALPVLLGILCVMTIMALIALAIYLASKPDTKTVEEIKLDRYKSCIEYSRPEDIFKCDVFAATKSL